MYLSIPKRFKKGFFLKVFDISLAFPAQAMANPLILHYLAFELKRKDFSLNY
jgi:hypothetical protein